MPRKIENPIKEGLPSKIYLRAYSATEAKPISRYQIAKDIYGTPQGQIPPTPKVINAVRDLLGEEYGKKYLSRTPEDKVFSDSEPLVTEIEKNLQLQGKNLTEDEKRELRELCEVPLRSAVEILLPSVDFKSDVNAYTYLTDIIGQYTLFKMLMLLSEKPAMKHMMSCTFENLMFAIVSNIHEPDSPDEVTAKELTKEWIDTINKISLSKSLMMKLLPFMPSQLKPVVKQFRIQQAIF